MGRSCLQHDLPQDRPMIRVVGEWSSELISLRFGVPGIRVRGAPVAFKLAFVGVWHHNPKP